MKSRRRNIHLVLSALLLLGMGALAAANTPRAKSGDFQQKEEVKQAIVDMVNAIDKKEWKAAVSAFDKEVFADYSSLTGQPGGKVKATELVGGWEKVLANVKTHHMLSNFDVSIKDGNAEVWSHVYGSHVSETAGYWDAIGRYHHKLRLMDGAWKIVEMTLIMHG